MVILATKLSMRWSGMISELALKSILASCFFRAERSSGSVDQGPPLLAAVLLALLPPDLLALMKGMRLTVLPGRLAVTRGFGPSTALFGCTAHGRVPHRGIRRLDLGVSVAPPHL